MISAISSGISVGRDREDGGVFCRVVRQDSGREGQLCGLLQVGQVKDETERQMDFSISEMSLLPTENFVRVVFKGSRIYISTYVYNSPERQ